MKVVLRVGLAVLVVSLAACGVREEETDASGTTSQSGNGLDEIDTDDGVSPFAGSAVGEEGTGNEVQLRFVDDYTGFWENDTRSDNLSTEIVRLSFGERYYHIETFSDQSTGIDGSGENCYSRKGLSLTNKNGLGLRGAAHEDKTVDYSEWTLDGDNLQSSIYDEQGELVSNSTGTATFSSALSGLAVGDLQICDNN